MPADDVWAPLAGRFVDGHYGTLRGHGVVMYVEDPRPFVAALADLAEPGGIVSLVAKNARSLITRPVQALQALVAHGNRS